MEEEEEEADVTLNSNNPTLKGGEQTEGYIRYTR